MHKKIIFMIASILIQFSMVWMTLSFVFKSDIPEGAPVDYFEVIDNIEQSNVEIFVYANEFKY